MREESKLRKFSLKVYQFIVWSFFFWLSGSAISYVFGSICEWTIWHGIACGFIYLLIQKLPDNFIKGGH